MVQPAVDHGQKEMVGMAISVGETTEFL